MARKKVSVGNPQDKSVQDKIKNLSDVANDISGSKKTENSLDKLIKDLVFLGRLSKDVKVSGYSFRVNTLTEERQRLLVSRIMRMTNDEKVAYAKVYTVAESVTHINDIGIEEISSRIDETNNVDEDNSEISKINFFGSLQAAIIDILFEEYEKLLGESKKEIGYEEVKK